MSRARSAIRALRQHRWEASKGNKLEIESIATDVADSVNSCLKPDELFHRFDGTETSSRGDAIIEAGRNHRLVAVFIASVQIESPA